jgi:tetratricopeptide (TPR) repeat protein
MAIERQDWKAATEHAQAALAINPLLPSPHRYLATAAEKLEDRLAAIEARRALLVLDPLDLAETHYRLAGLLHAEGKNEEARRHVLQSLEQAPRYRDAHKLLLRIIEKPSAGESDETKSPPR